MLADEIKDEILSRAAGVGLSQANAVYLAEAVSISICSRYRGEMVYFPKKTDIDLDALRAEFNGKNHRFLAKKYNKSISWMYEKLSPKK